MPVWVGFRVQLAGVRRRPTRLTSSSPGYTLVEVLAALAVLGLAIGGLSAAIQVLSKLQGAVSTNVARAQAVRAAQVSLDRMFEAQGPFRSVQAGQFTGDAARFQFECGKAAPCTVALVDAKPGLSLTVGDGEGGSKTLPLRQKGPAEFEYAGSRTVMRAWPPTTPDREILRSISLVQSPPGGGETPILQTRLWVEQFAACTFDPVQQDCEPRP